MNKSESIAEIATALAKAQAEISNARKNSKNPHFKSSYADLGEILNVVRPVFSLHDMAVIQAPQYENGAVTVETMLTHKSGEWISSSVSAPVSKQDAQGVGSAITYCRRYGLAAMAGIAQEDDDANSAVGGPNNRNQAAQQQQAAQPQQDKSQIELRRAIKQHQASIDVIKQGIASGELSSASEAWFELTDDEKQSLWAAPSKGGPFTTQEREAMKTSEFRLANQQPADSQPTGMFQGA